jgi:hypothetical protein
LWSCGAAFGWRAHRRAGAVIERLEVQNVGLAAASVGAEPAQLGSAASSEGLAKPAAEVAAASVGSQARWAAAA